MQLIICIIKIIIETFLKINAYAKSVLQSGGHLICTMLLPYIKLLISIMKLRVLNTDVLIIKVSLTDGMRLIYHYTVILSFFNAAILETIQNGG